MSESNAGSATADYVQVLPLEPQPAATLTTTKPSSAEVYYATGAIYADLTVGHLWHTKECPGPKDEDRCVCKLNELRAFVATLETGRT